MENLAASRVDLERFVYADVVDEPNGMPITVISALSRQGIDPWEEAQRLSELSPPEATDGLAQILRRLPAVQSARLDARLIASRLVGLLPDANLAPQLAAARASASAVQLPKGFAFVMLGFMFAGLVLPLLAPQKTDTVAPASWLTEGSNPPANVPSGSAKTNVADNRPQPPKASAGLPSELDA